ncbi:Small heat shock protein, chloroplastic [Linum perenne]
MIDTMNRFMDDPFVLQGDIGGYMGRGRMPWAIQEGESDYKLRFDIPGMGKSDVKVWVEDNMLVLKGEKAVNTAGNEEWLRKSYGKYSYRIALPDNIEFEKIKAEVKDGVLYVTIPKAHTTRKVLDIDIE